MVLTEIATKLSVFEGGKEADPSSALGRAVSRSHKRP